MWTGDEEKQVLGKTEAMSKRKKKTKHRASYMELACIICMFICFLLLRMHIRIFQR